MKFFNYDGRGFTLVELMVVISVIGILSAIVYANFGSARGGARDDVRKAALKELQLAVELYKAQNGEYPSSGCSAANNEWAGPGPTTIFVECADYVVGLVPEYIPELPLDPAREDTSNWGFYYRSNGSDYKLLIRQSVEVQLITSVNDEFARCPTASGACASDVPPNSYAVYSAGAANW